MSSRRGVGLGRCTDDRAAATVAADVRASFRARAASATATAATAAATAIAVALCALPASAAPPFEDTIAQRVLACTGCHGAAGRAAPDGYYPRLAGKPAGYLYNQLRNFRDGRRHYAPMSALLRPLDGAAGELYLLEIAVHFASLELPYAASPTAATPAARPGAAEAAAMARGEALVRRGDPARQLPACAQCHGEALMGVAPAIPGLLGLPRDYLNAQLGAWRNGDRQAQAPDCMAQVAKALAPADVAALSGWLAAQPVPAGARPAAAPGGAGAAPGGAGDASGPARQPVRAGEPPAAPAAAARPAAAWLPLPCGGVPVVSGSPVGPR